MRLPKRRTVLIADDDVAIQQLLPNVFRDRGYTVHVAGTASQARALAKEHRPHIAIVDLRLGRDWGLDLIPELRRRNRRIHIVLLSGYVSVASAIEAIQAGAADVVFKPIRPIELLRRIEYGARRRRELPKDEAPSLARAAYEHMCRILADCNGNVSEAARRLGVHRNTLQRMLRNIPEK